MTTEKIFINDDWLFTRKFDSKLIQPKAKKTDFKDAEIVRIPHSFVKTPYNYFDESVYQMQGGYRKEFKTEKAWAGKKVFVNFDGAAHQASVYFNGKLLGVHNSGYTAFKFDITKLLSPAGKNNVLSVKLDSSENLDIPPFGFVIDYMTYGGIYRDVYLEVKNDFYIEDIFVKTVKNSVTTDITFCSPVKENSFLRVTVKNLDKSKLALSSEKVFCEEFDVSASGSNTKRLDFVCKGINYWSPESPSLYLITIDLLDSKKKLIDQKTVRFGFRDIEMKADGFYLNGKKYKLRGLDRHQSYPYVGYAMPQSVQEYDADILKNELALNAVRTSHYPQSQYFIDRCDEIGLFVFTEIPGWQHIGESSQWREQAVRNVQEMVLQYRNHPSIFLWGVRINESQDDDELYAKTNAACRELDSTRPTGGVRYIKKSNLLEDVYTYNDFIHDGTNEGCEPKSRITSNQKKAYLISEYCGHMFPTKIFDDELHRTEHAMRHANVLDSVMKYDDIAGSFGWCAFDYNTHQDFGSGDRICYHGVMDMFRNPKLASSIYQIQQDETPVLEISSSMDVGEHPAIIRGKNWIFTNADSVKMYVNNVFIAEFKESKSPYKNLKHGPILIDDYLGERLVKEEGLSAAASKLVKEIINYTAMYGQNKYRLEHLRTMLLLRLRGIGYKKLRAIYDKYVGNWGGEATVFKFEAVKNGKVVKTLLKGPVRDIHIEAVCSKTELHEGSSWDAAVVRIAMKDQFGNVLPYYNECVSLKASGPVELIGPESDKSCVTCFRGGVTGTWVRTTGKKGKAALEISSAGKTLELSFSVK